MKKSIFSFAGIFATLNFALWTLNSSAQYTKLIDFTGTTNGSTPLGSLISDGTFLYGTTSDGGPNSLGTAFKIMPDGTGYVDLQDFAGVANGSYPYGDFISVGSFLYGTTSWGGANNVGTVFKISPNGTGYSNLHSFSGTNTYPWGSLISDGTFLYGMTKGGGANMMGTIFKIMPDGSGFTVLMDFAGTNGSGPNGSLFSDGTFFYGTTYGGGTGGGGGTLFKIMPDGSGYTKLIDFDGTTNGAYPMGSIISDGTFLYGMTYMGGTNMMGTIFKIKPDGTQYSTLLNFDGTSQGSYPKGSLISDGTFLYGMTSDGGTNSDGVLFQIMPNGTAFSKLLDFAGTTNGKKPCGSLLLDGNILYGMTSKGGTNDFGVVFKYGISTDVTENNKENGFMVFPNPTTGKFKIKNNDQQIKNYNLEIYNILGEKVYSNSEFDKQLSNEIDLSNSPKGIYFVKLYDGVKIVNNKIIVQ